MRKIFCVEDDVNIRELLEYTLKNSGFDVSCFECASAFFDTIETRLPDLVLLDIMLPDMDGMEILKHIRESGRTKNLPVIMLTAKSSGLDKIKGLDGGADDYITKPFDILELISRINAVLRRTGTNNSCGNCDITIDLEKRRVSAAGKPVVLTYKEFELLNLLMQNPGIVFSRDKLMLKIWGTDFEGETRTVDVHIRSLRSKLGKCSEHIKTIRNVGYAFD